MIGARNIFLSILLFSFAAGEANAGPGKRNELGTPIIENYTPDDYKDEAQVLSSVQDFRGVMYFGTTGAILEFDGVSWRKLTIPTMAVFAMAVDEKGTVYAGMENDIGFLASDSKGEMKYVSMVEKIPKKEREFGRVLYCHATSNGVYFITDEKIFRWADGAIEVIPQLSSGVFSVKDVLYVVGADKGIFVRYKGELRPVTYFDQFDSVADLGRVRIFLWQEGKALIATAKQGLFVHDLKRFLQANPNQSVDEAPPSYVTQLETDAGEYLGTYPVLSGVRLNNKQFALGTFGGGIVVVDNQGRLVQVINSNRGLPDDLVFHVFRGKEENLWASTNNGISHINTSSPLSVFDKRNGIEHRILAVHRYNQTLYLGTFKGIYALAPYQLSIRDDIQKFELLQGTNDQCWALFEHQGALFSALGDRVVQISGRSSRSLYESESAVLSFAHSKRFKDYIFVGTTSGIRTFKINRQAKLSTPDSTSPKPADEVPDVSLEIVENETLMNLKGSFYYLAEDSTGDLWASDRAGGVFRIVWLSNRLDDLKVTYYGVEDGLPMLAANNVFFIEDQILVATQKGIYKFDGDPTHDGTAGKGRFVPEKTLGKLFYDSAAYVSSITVDRNQEIWVGNDEGFGPMRRSSDGSYRWDTRLTSIMSGKFRASFVDVDNTIWIGTTEGLYRYDSSKLKDVDGSYNALIRKVTLGRDNSIYQGTYMNPGAGMDDRFWDSSLTQPSRMIPVIEYQNNTMLFEFAATFFEFPQDTNFQYRLAGFDEDWSAWTNERNAKYTNVPHGRYKFIVRAKNIYDRISKDATFSFSILPPWYRTKWAYLGYVALGALFFIGGTRLYNWRLIVVQKRLQQVVKERTREVVRQKEEISSQAEQLKLTNEALWGEMQLAKKIQTVLLPKEPAISGYDIAAYMNPADDVGGDYYDIINIGGTDWILIGDVSGHGVPAGLVMMMAQTSVHSVLENFSGEPPKKILETVNRVLRKNIAKLGEDKYMTITIFSVHPDGTLCFSGLHQDILVYRGAIGEVEQIETNGMWIGMIDEIGEMLEVKELKLDKGDAMLLFTDGLTEARDADGKMFSSEKLAELFRNSGRKSAREIERDILDALQGLESDDDVTFMVVKRAKPVEA